MDDIVADIGMRRCILFGYHRVHKNSLDIEWYGDTRCNGISVEDARVPLSVACGDVSPSNGDKCVLLINHIGEWHQRGGNIWPKIVDGKTGWYWAKHSIRIPVCGDVSLTTLDVCSLPLGHKNEMHECGGYMWPKIDRIGAVCDDLRDKVRRRHQEVRRYPRARGPQTGGLAAARLRGMSRSGELSQTIHC